MINVALLGLNDSCASSLFSPIDVMQIANGHLRQQLGDTAELFHWQIVTPDGEPVTASGGVSFKANAGLDQEKWDAIIIPGIYYFGAKSFTAQLQKWGNVREWLLDQWHEGAVLAANCTGTFLLAESGLLDGQEATTSWWAEQHFRTSYPRVQVDVNRLMTESDRLICTGALTSILQLAIRLVEYFTSQTIASLTAKTMLIDIGQTNQSFYFSLSEINSHNDRLVARAQHHLQRNQGSSVSLELLAQTLAISHRTLIRRFKSAIGMTPQTYLQKLRMDTAKQLLETSMLRIAHIAEQVGYSDVGAFNKIFYKHVGLTPRVYREKSRPK